MPPHRNVIVQIPVHENVQGVRYTKAIVVGKFRLCVKRWKIEL